MSENLVVSRDWAISWAGLRTTTTAAVRMAKIPMTINNSTRVKLVSSRRDGRFCFLIIDFISILSSVVGLVF